MVSVDGDLPELNAENYTNRELSWLEFNRRVLEQAQDETVPLLERVKFLAIFSDNLDEFYMVRVAYVHEKATLGVPSPRPDGIAPAALLMEIRKRALEMMAEQRATMREVFAQLEQQGVCIEDIEKLDAEAKD